MYNGWDQQAFVEGADVPEPCHEIHWPRHRRSAMDLQG